MDKNREYIKKIENELVDILCSSSLFAGQKSHSIKIISYFVTRKTLTQAKIKELTNLSLGTISQELSNLIKRGIIEKKKISSTGEITYVMASIKKSFFNSYYYTLKKAKNTESELREVHKELEINKDELKNQDGFKELYNLTSIYLKIFLVIDQIADILKEKT